MKIILTGHTSAIGQVLHKHLGNTYDVVGVSRTTGYNLLDTNSMQRLVEEAKTADHFINLANITVQPDILYNIHTSWSEMGKAGKIINFGTLVREIPFPLLKKFNIDMTMVSTKLTLEKMHKELAYKQFFGKQPQSVLLRFANYGQKTADRSYEPSNTAEQIIDIIEFVLNNNTYISRLDFREI